MTTASKELGEATDALNWKLGKVQDALRARFTVPGKVELQEGHLHYRKNGSVWMLVHVNGEGHEADIRSCSRAVRVQASLAIADLIKDIKAEEKLALSVVLAAGQALDKALKDL